MIVIGCCLRQGKGRQVALVYFLTEGTVVKPRLKENQALSTTNGFRLHSFFQPPAELNEGRYRVSRVGRALRMRSGRMRAASSALWSAQGQVGPFRGLSDHPAETAGPAEATAAADQNPAQLPEQAAWPGCSCLGEGRGQLKAVDFDTDFTLLLANEDFDFIGVHGNDLSSSK